MKGAAMQYILSIEARGSSPVTCPLSQDVYRIGSGSACQIRIATKSDHALTLFRRGPAFFALNRTSETLRIGNDQFAPNSTMPWAPGRRLQLEGTTLRLEAAIPEQVATRMVYSRAIEPDTSEKRLNSQATVPATTANVSGSKPANMSGSKPANMSGSKLANMSGSKPANMPGSKTTAKKRRSMLTTIVMCVVTVVTMHFIAGVAAELQTRRKAELQSIACEIQQIVRTEEPKSAVQLRNLALLSLVSRLQFADALDETANRDSAKFEIRIFCESLQNSSHSTPAELKIADELIRWINPSE
ncbi:MAG: hypothetical protein JNL58_17185 [Planctomyces sp.]|nr:hypothetical protein [Planctomyces sp.]